MVNGADNCIIDGFVIAGGNADGSQDDGYGGGMFNESDATTTIRNCTFKNNRASAGGGFFGGAESVDSCNFVHNQAEYGGAIDIWLSAEVLIKNSNFNENKAMYGGAISGRVVNPQIHSCSFTNNEATEDGGAIYIKTPVPGYQDWIRIYNSYFENNTANEKGGAIMVVNSEQNGAYPALANCVFVNNAAFTGGGLYYINNGTLRIVNCTFADNTNGNLYTRTDMVSGQRSKIYNSIFWGNDDEIPDTYLELSYCVIEEGCSDTMSRICEEITEDNPLFESDSVQLQQDSPCIDEGLSSALPADYYDLDEDGNTSEAIPFDIDGNPRVIGDIVDIGAYEYQ